MAQGISVKRVWTTQDLTDASDEYIHRVEEIYGKFDAFMQVNPEFAAMMGALYQGDKDIYKKAMLKKLEYCMTIHTEKEWKKQQERCENAITMGGVLDIPVVVILDPQLLERRVFMDGSFPTYYSSWVKKLFDDTHPGFVVAYPPRITEMSDEEVRVALAHEFGHIKQKHMFQEFKAENQGDVNAAMDYSINWAFNHDDITLYEELARKMFDGQTGVTKVPFPEKKGGLDNQINISHYWKEILTLMKILRGKDEKGGDGQPPPTDEIEVGNIIIERKKGGGYARVTDIDPVTGKITADPMTKEEVEEERKEEAQRQAGGGYNVIK